MSDAGDALQNIVNQNTKIADPRGVGINLGLNVAFATASILAFNLLRPRNRIVYEPKTKYFVGEKQPERVGKGFFSWLSPLVHAKEPELLEMIGLDGVTYLRFLRMCRHMFTLVALLACAITIPVDIVYNQQKNPKGRTVLSQLTVQDVHGTILFVHVGVTYLITIIAFVFIWFNWRAMVKLRYQWFRSPEYQKSFYARTLMVQKVPRNLQSDAGLVRLFDELRVPYPTSAVHIGRRVGELPELIEYHNRAVRDLEQVLVTYLRKGDLGKKRPTITQGGFLGLGGTKHDAIDFYTARIKATEEAIESARNNIDLRRPESYGFASMAAVPYAHIVAKMLAGKKQRGGSYISLAPNPKDIIWKNLTKGDAKRASDRLFGWFILCLVCFLNTLPLTLVSALANLSAIQAYVGFLRQWGSASPTTFGVVSAVLPPAISTFFGYFLPKIMRALSKYQGDLTRSRLDRAVTARMFGFQIISQLVVFTLLGVIFQQAKNVVGQIEHQTSFVNILKSFKDLPEDVQTTYVRQSNYWLTYFPLRGFLAFFDLAQLLTLVWTSMRTRLFGRTPRDIREWTQPPPFEYAVFYSGMLFNAAVGFAYAPLAPLVPLLAAAVFWASSVVYKYQLMFVFITKVESGGRLWNVAINRMLACLVFMQLLMLLTIGLSQGWGSFMWTSLLPAIVLVFLFKIYINRTFLRRFRYYIPNEQEIAVSKIHSERADAKAGRLEKRFGHPALHADLYTPMVHAKMVHLLPQVYHGRLAQDQAKLGEYGGQKVQAAVTSGGLKIAGIEQNDLEYDPALFRRDRGELDWDARSIASTNMLQSPGSELKGQADYFHHGRQPSIPLSMMSHERDAYMQHGPTGMRPGPGDASTSQIELTRFDSRGTGDNAPLLSRGVPMGMSSAASLHQTPRTDSPHQMYANPNPSGSRWDLEEAYRMQAGTPSPPQGYGQRPLPPSRQATVDTVDRVGQALYHQRSPSQPPSRSSTPGPNGGGGGAPRQMMMHPNDEYYQHPYTPPPVPTLPGAGGNGGPARPGPPSRQATVDSYYSQQSRGPPPPRSMTGGGGGGGGGGDENMAGRGARRQQY